MKNLFKISTKLLPILIITALPKLGVANENLGQDLSEIQEEMSNQIHKFIEKGGNNKYIPIPKGKSEIEALFGNWLLTFTIVDTYTDRLELNKLGRDSEGRIVARGNSFANNKGQANPLTCWLMTEISPKTAIFLDTEYTCLSVSPTTIELYAFTFSGNNITNGYYGIGLNAKEAIEAQLSKGYKITGHRKDTPLPITKNNSLLTNISTRANIGGGQNDAFAGFVIEGNAAKKVIIRGIGIESGVDPKILVLNHNTKVEVGQNDDWGNNANANEISQLPSHLQLPNGNDAGLLVSLNPGIYDVVLSSTGASGLALVSIDDLQPDSNEKIVNISTRANISGGQDNAFAGFVITGTQPKKVIIRGIAVENGVNPEILVLDHNTKAEIGKNDDWASNANANEIGQLPSHLQLPKTNDAGLLVTLNPGVYDVILSSTTSSGLAIVSIDEVSQ